MSGNVQQNSKHIFDCLYAGYGTNIRVGEELLYFLKALPNRVFININQ